MHRDEDRDDTAAAPQWRVAAAQDISYEIQVVEPLLDLDEPALLAGGNCPGRRFVVLDDGVPPLWRDRLGKYFAHHGIATRFLVVPGGERCKTMETVMSIVAGLREYGVDRRNEPVVVVGGGALLDAGSFAASIYRRGVPFIRVPTTVLAYVDASVGIKTGVNFGTGKNLLGSFSAPSFVLLDREFFTSLPPREISSGLGEILKLGLGCDARLFEMLEARAGSLRATRMLDDPGFEILQRSIDIMLRELQPDIFESDLRRSVDLGHTFSQAFEMAPSRDPMRHGEAVAVDLNLSAIIAFRRGLLAEDEMIRLAELTRRLGLPTAAPGVEPAAVWASVTERTEHRAGAQRAPLPSRIGDCTFVNDLSAAEVEEAFAVLQEEPAIRLTAS